MELLQLLVFTVLTDLVTAQSISPSEVVGVPGERSRGGRVPSIIQSHIFELVDKVRFHTRTNRLMVRRGLSNTEGHREEGVGGYPKLIPFFFGVENLETFVIFNEHFVGGGEFTIGPSLRFSVLEVDVGLLISPLPLFSHDER